MISSFTCNDHSIHDNKDIVGIKFDYGESCKDEWKGSDELLSMMKNAMLPLHRPYKSSKEIESNPKSFAPDATDSSIFIPGIGCSDLGAAAAAADVVDDVNFVVGNLDARGAGTWGASLFTLLAPHSSPSDVVINGKEGYWEEYGASSSFLDVDDDCDIPPLCIVVTSLSYHNDSDDVSALYDDPDIDDDDCLPPATIDVLHGLGDDVFDKEEEEEEEEKDEEDDDEREESVNSDHSNCDEYCNFETDKDEKDDDATATTADDYYGEFGDDNGHVDATS